MNARTSWALFQTHTSAKSRGPRAGQLHLQLGVHKFDKRASASFSRSPIKILNEPGPTTEPCDGPASCLAQLEPAKSPDEASSKKGSFSTSARGTAQFPAGAVVIYRISTIIWEKNKQSTSVSRPTHGCLHYTWIQAALPTAGPWSLGL